MSTYYRAIIIDPSMEESTDAVQYVGVYVLHWHKHPAQPEIGFVPVDIDQLILAAKKALKYLEDPHSDAMQHLIEDGLRKSLREFDQEPT